MPALRPARFGAAAGSALVPRIRPCGAPSRDPGYSPPLFQPLFRRANQALGNAAQLLFDLGRGGGAVMLIERQATVDQVAQFRRGLGVEVFHRYEQALPGAVVDLEVTVLGDEAGRMAVGHEAVQSGPEVEDIGPFADEA